MTVDLPLLEAEHQSHLAALAAPRRPPIGVGASSERERERT
jgi:hypothetical protein